MPYRHSPPQWEDEWFTREEVTVVFAALLPLLLADGYQLVEGSVERETITLRHPTIAGRLVKIEIENIVSTDDRTWEIDVTIMEAPGDWLTQEFFLASNGPGVPNVDAAHIQSQLREWFLPANIWED